MSAFAYALMVALRRARRRRARAGAVRHDAREGATGRRPGRGLDATGVAVVLELVPVRRGHSPDAGEPAAVATTPGSGVAVGPADRPVHAVLAPVGNERRSPVPARRRSGGRGGAGRRRRHGRRAFSSRKRITAAGNPVALLAPRARPFSALSSNRWDMASRYQPVTSSRPEPISARLRTVLTPAAPRAAYFSSAVPLPPAMMAPAWPMRLPGGAVTPAM